MSAECRHPDCLRPFVPPLQASRFHEKSDRIQARAAGVLRLLSVDAERKIHIADNAGIDALVRMAYLHPKNPTVQMDVAGALSNLAVDDELEERIALAGGINILVEALTLHIGRASLVADVWHALTNLSNALGVHGIFIRSPPDFVISLFAPSPTHRPFAAENKNRLFQAKGFRNLVASSVEKHSKVPNVMGGIAATLRNLAHLDEGASSALSDIGVCVGGAASVSDCIGGQVMRKSLMSCALAACCNCFC